MKFLSPCALVAASLMLCFHPVRAERLFGIDDAWMQEQITAPPEALPIDEAFAALSRAASINAFVDATHLPIDQILQPYSMRPKSIYDTNSSGRSSVVGNAVSQAGMTFDRTAKDTFVFWREPDINRTVNLIVARQKQLKALYPPADDKTTLTALEEFYARTQDWPVKPVSFADKQRRAHGVEAIALTDLPAQLQSALQAELLQRLIKPAAAPDYSWFEPQSWKDGRVRLVEEQVNRYDAAGRSPARGKAWVVKVFFSPERPPFWVGAPHWAVPNQLELADFTLPSFLSEGERLSQFEAAPDAQPTAPRPLPAALDFKEEAFQKTVKFEAKRSDLRDFVSNLSKQSGLAFSVAPDVGPGAKTLAASPGMSLGAALTALERLYGARWVKAAQGYQLQSQGLDELHQNLVQLGIKTLYERVAYWSAQRGAIGRQIADEVTGAFDWDQLKAEKGAPLSELPIEVQSRIVELFRVDNAGKLIVNQQRQNDALAQAANFFIRLSAVPEDAPQLFGAFRSYSVSHGSTFFRTRGVTGATVVRKPIGLSAWSPDGRYVTELFPQFTIYPPTESDKTRDEIFAKIEQDTARNLKDFQNQTP